MRSATEIKEIESLIRTITVSQPSAFSIRLKGAPPDHNIMAFLGRHYPELQNILDCFIVSTKIAWRYTPELNATVVELSQVQYMDNQKIELILYVSGWTGFQKAHALARMARCAHVAIIVEFHPEELASAQSNIAQYLLDRLSQEMDSSENLYGDPWEFSQRRRTHEGSVWNSQFSPNRWIFCLNQYQFESYHIRIGLQTEICKLNHSLFANRNYTDREKVLVVDRWIRDNIEYLDEDNNADHSAAVTLMRRKGVCQGIASLVVAMLQMENIPAIYIRGCFTDTSSHAWNMVRLDGRWLHLDCTWGQNYTGTDHPYLLRTDENFPKHTWDHAIYGHEANEKRAVSIERLNRHHFNFLLHEMRYTVDDTIVTCPRRAPMIEWGQQRMIDMVSLFSFLKLGYRQNDHQLCIYTRHRLFAFPIGRDDTQAPCQILMKDNNLYISVHALAQLPGVSVSAYAESVTVKTQ